MMQSLILSYHAARFTLWFTVGLITVSLLMRHPSTVCAQAETGDREAPDISIERILDMPWQTIALHVEIDGEPIEQIWARTFEQLFDFVDRDRNDRLDGREAKALPAAFLLRQPLWGRFEAWTTELPFQELDLNSNGEVDRQELTNFYRRQGIGGAQLVLNAALYSRPLTDAMILHLDRDRDRGLSTAEFASLLDNWSTVDLNQDHLISPGEWISDIFYPGTTGNQLALPPTSRPDAEAARRFRWQVRWHTSNIALCTFTIIDNERESKTFDLRSAIASSHVNERWQLEQKRYQARFRDADLDHSGALSAEEQRRHPASALRDLARIADRDDDGQLAASELLGWFELESQILRGLIQITITDLGSGLFEAMDENRDGSLSKAECLATCAQVAQRRTPLDVSQLQRHILVTASRGSPSAAIASTNSDANQPQRASWAKKMDQNGDGWVSKNEFLGQPSAFDRWDVDHDGFLRPEELPATDENG